MSWLKPSDIVEKLSSDITNTFVFPVKVRGIVIFQKGYYKLTDGEAGITLNVPPSMELPVGAEVEIEGVICANPFVKGDVAMIYPAINVNSYKVLDEDKEREFQKKLTEVEALLRNRNHYGFWDTLTKLLGERGRIKIGLIHGNSAQVWQDFISGFRSAAGKYADRVEFVRFESSLSDEGLAKTIKEAAKSGVSAIFLLRGGGSQEELARIGGFESIKAIIHSNIPFYTAIGHSFDRMVSLIEKVADGHFATPSIAGQELGKLVYTVSELESPRGEVKEKPSKISKVVITIALELLLILLILFLGLKLLPKFFARLFDGG